MDSGGENSETEPRGTHRLRMREADPNNGPRLLACHGVADDLLVIAGDHVAVGESGVGPVDGTEFAPVARIGGWLDQLGPAHFLIALWRQSRDNQLTPVVVDEISISVANDKA